MASSLQLDFVESRPLPRRRRGGLDWLRRNFFSSPLSALFTVLAVLALSWMLLHLADWAIVKASWAGSDRKICDANPYGACWTMIRVRFNQIMFGLFYGGHPDQIWRPVAAFGLLLPIAGPLFVPGYGYKGLHLLVLALGYPALAYGLVNGGMFGLVEAPTSQWGGFMLTFILASVGIIGSLPIGIMLALGRRSSLPAIRMICIVFIEVWRANPLITVLFMVANLLPLFVPSGIDLDKVARALVAITLFQSAYTAEAVRGGLAAIPKGQFEAAHALGLSRLNGYRLIILPQALKISIPGIVNAFIELFKDTSLVAIIGLFDFLRMAQVVVRSPEWRGFEHEAYVFTALVYWVICFGMSKYSQLLESRLERGHVDG
ncbi:amino acid ABC transporter permease [Mesorhizobium koreense]|uniref:amino acid ABC transporter permease n=1 Tax=Mesorhizobium koreense TaxID=3074855 RepID=UPI00287B6DE0|nr:amino acid ABC transporter permease [Mesorhizobium sp. WR6]